MAMTAHTDGLTAEEICQQAEALAGHPNLHLHPSTGAAPTSEAELDATPAYIWLNELIQHKLMTGDWPFLETAATVNITARENDLPANYWRQRFDHGLFLLDGSSRYQLIRCTPEYWHSSVLAATSPGQGRPTHYFLDRARQSFYVDRVPDQSYQAEMHYQRTIGRITDKDQVPGRDPNNYASLPYPWLLVNLLVEAYYKHQNDQRWQQQKIDNQQLVAEVRNSISEPFDTEPSIPLDSRMFLTPRYS